MKKTYPQALASLRLKKRALTRAEAVLEEARKELDEAAYDVIHHEDRASDFVRTTLDILEASSDTHLYRMTKRHRARLESKEEER